MDQWIRELPLRAKRGDIVDVNGVAMATSQTSYDVYIRPSMVQNAVSVASILHNVLGVEYEVAFDKASNRFVSEVLVQTRISEIKAKELIKQNVSGIMLSENNTRVYPYDNYLSRVLGYTTVDAIGQAGLELYYDRYLTGVDGKVVNDSDVHGVTIEGSTTKYLPSISGLNIKLTVDSNIQYFAEKALEKLVLEQKPKNASIIVMNPNNGGIYAMATSPSINLNDIPRDNVEYLMEVSKNLNIVDVYEPGSTFKSITMAYAIEKGVAKLSDTFSDPGYRIVDGEKIKCWKLTGHGHQTLTEGLCNSCNSVFIDLALRLGKDEMYNMFETFGFGTRLGIDFYGESAGIIMDKSYSKNVDVARMGFGQAIACTPIQLITAFCSLVNGGKLLKPHFVNEIFDNNGNKILVNDTTVIKETISKNTSDILKEMLEAVITQYSGANTFIEGHRIGGKTGTTQKYEDGKISGTYIASFIGAYPIDKPDYVVMVIVDEPGGDSYYGSIAATPYAKILFEDIIEYKDYKKVTSDTDKINTKIAMPNVVGLRVEDAIFVLEKNGLYVEIQGEGSVVTKQLPAPNVELNKRSVVLIDSA
ncbi:MAG: PASTA domain-containing protein [Clostridia bacterium]|nr:PASTA domain-containing protein [Clostridia bacterium]